MPASSSAEMSRKADGEEFAAHFGYVTVAVNAHPSACAERPVHRVGAEMVVRQSVAAFDAYGFGLDGDAPVSRLAADRAVALARSFRQVEVGLDVDIAAMAASPIGFRRHRSLPRSCDPRG